MSLYLLSEPHWASWPFTQADILPFAVKLQAESVVKVANTVLNPIARS